MAYDPQARKQSNSALIIGLIALLVVGGAALAYFATRHADTPETSPVIVSKQKETVVVTNTPVPANDTLTIVAPTPAPAPNVVVVAPPANPATNPVRNTDPAPRAPVASPPADNSDKGKTTINNNTIINPPAPSANANKARPIQPDATNADNTATANAAPVDSNEVQGY